MSQNVKMSQLWILRKTLFLLKWGKCVVLEPKIKFLLNLFIYLSEIITDYRHWWVGRSEYFGFVSSIHIFLQNDVNDSSKFKDFSKTVHEVFLTRTWSQTLKLGKTYFASDFWASKCKNTRNLQNLFIRFFWNFIW